MPTGGRKSKMEVRKNCVAVNKRSPLWRPVAPRVAAVGPEEGGVPRNRRGPRWGENLPLGRASIASGYTPAAFAGAKPLYPLPLKGRKET